MKKSLFLILFTLNFGFSEHLLDKSNLRRKFYESVENSKVAKQYLLELNELKSEKNPLVNGYFAATCMVMADHVFNPYSKFKYFIDGKNHLEITIKQFPDNLELRLIRFAIQTNAPAFLGYTKEIQTDKDYLIKNFAKLSSSAENDLELKKLIIDYLKKSKVCNREEIEMLTKN
jgi:hypothetical protein